MADAAVLTVQRCYPQIYRACHTRHRRAASSSERLSERDGAILAHLDAREPRSAATLARHLGVGQPTLSAALERLTRLGFVERHKDPGDGRRAQILLGKRGLRALQAASVLDKERLASVLGRLSLAERRDACRGLALLARASGEEMAARGRN